MASSSVLSESATSAMPTSPPARCSRIETCGNKRKASTDQSGSFPTTSRKGNKYLMVLHEYDSNTILAKPTKNRSEVEIVRSYTTLHGYLCSRGLKPTLHFLDNECPAGLKKFMAKADKIFQLVPPHRHHTNHAKKVIGTFKEHLIARICSYDPSFSMHLWDRNIPQDTTTLNLLRPSRINPRLSDEAQLNGTFNFNATSFAPSGTKVLIQENP